MFLRKIVVHWRVSRCFAPCLYHRRMATGTPLVKLILWNFLLPNIIYDVFVIFSDNKLALNHSEIIWSSSFICLSRTSKDLPVINRFVSSANMMVWRSGDAKLRSLMYKRNSNGPRIEPCGTPQVIRSQFDSLRPIITYCRLFVK